MLYQTEESCSHTELLEPTLFEAIIKTLLYFDIFHYPLTRDEILKFLGKSSTRDEVNEAVTVLVEKGYVYQFNEFLSVSNNRHNVLRRLKGNEMAAEMMTLARRKAHFIGKFPFVRSVMISGSLSKGYMDKDSDIDFFVVTEPGRLWISRMLLVLYKRIFLGNSHKHFCVNYFVSSDKLEIEEKNQFTATELATVLPMYNTGIYGSLMESNGWLRRFFPNYSPKKTMNRLEKVSTPKRITEKVIDVLGGNFIDDLCMKMTYSRWVRVYKSDYAPADFSVAFKTKKYASKNHPRDYQRKITDVLQMKWLEYNNHFNLRSI
jgi:predicted nucleotidyltransferase